MANNSFDLDSLLNELSKVKGPDVSGPWMATEPVLQGEAFVSLSLNLLREQLAETGTQIKTTKKTKQTKKANPIIPITAKSLVTSILSSTARKLRKDFAVKYDVVKTNNLDKHIKRAFAINVYNDTKTSVEIAEYVFNAMAGKVSAFINEANKVAHVLNANNESVEVKYDLSVTRVMSRSNNVTPSGKPFIIYDVPGKANNNGAEYALFTLTINQGQEVKTFKAIIAVYPDTIHIQTLE